jgi:alpha-D-xyloside xylohydrolase
MIAELSAKNYKLNLWEHAFTNPASPVYAPLYPHSGNFEVWGGLVPDFLSPEARNAFAAYHDKAHVAIGVSGYKLDECDNSDFTGNWSFPEIASFPSGADGEQMHSVFGLRYQDTIQSVFDRHKLRTYGLVRSSGALAAPYPYALYSDLYDHSQFIRALVNSGFSGLLWTPEVRDAASEEDLIRRLQTTILSPLALINAWYIKNPPWKQLNRSKNNAGELAPDWQQLESRCRSVLNLRMQIIPYLHAAFVRYHLEGLPPVRALVVDYPRDANTYGIDDQYLLGESLLVAPLVAGREQRSVYLPEGDWYCFWTRQRYAGKQHVSAHLPLEQIPLFVKSGAILPLAPATSHSGDSAAWSLTAMGYGSGPLSVELFEEDGSVSPEITRLHLAWNPGQETGTLRRVGPLQNPHYSIAEWKRVI